MLYRTILIAATVLAAASDAFAQQTDDPAMRPREAAAEPVADEPVSPRRTREEVYVTGARQIPVPPVEGALPYAQRQRDRAEGRCVLQAQESADPTEPDFGTPEEVCRTR
jgi:hypothetical protein